MKHCSMRPFLAALLLCSVCLPAAAQIRADSARQFDPLRIYRRALEYNDMGSAAYALTTYLLEGGDARYRDTLAIIYYRQGNASGAYRLATEINSADPKNTTALTLLADISGRAGDTKTSLDWYEKLCPLAPSPYNHYQLATRQFMLERIGECRKTLQRVVADSLKAREEKVALEISPGNPEEVPVLAAAYNMLGALSYRDQQTAEARKYYQLALKEHPAFVIARQNLDSLAPAKPGKTTPAGKPKS
jgi:tetratricopeptide (TPR) repeat protein